MKRKMKVNEDHTEAREEIELERGEKIIIFSILVCNVFLILMGIFR